MLRGIDRAAFSVALATRLRRSGVPVRTAGVEHFVAALDAVPPVSKQALYWVSRIALVSRHGDLAVFDAVFAAVFDAAVLDMDPHARRKPLGGGSSDQDKLASVPATSNQEDDGAGLPWITLPRVVAGSEESDSEIAVPERMPSALAPLAEVPFEDLSPAELAQLGAWLSSTVTRWPTRRSRRFELDRKGQRIAIRATVARARRTGFEAIDLVRAKQMDRPRQVVMLCDVSQSMQAQAAAYLHLMRALTLVSPTAEVFAFATRLTRLTAVLRQRSSALAMAQATDKVVDRFGGTRIASNLTALLRSPHGGLLRGAVVIVASDGWDSDSPEELAAAMNRLRRRAFRVIWMNPRASAPGFEPRVSTMVAALPYCDKMLPADTFASLQRVVAELAT